MCARYWFESWLIEYSTIGWTIASQRYQATGSTAAGRAVIALIFVFMFSYNLAWSGLLIGYVSQQMLRASYYRMDGIEVLMTDDFMQVIEISPFYLRSKYITTMLVAVAAGLFFSNYVNPVGLTRLTWKYYVVYICWLAIQSVVVWLFYIETKGRSLETIAVCFDGEDAKVGGAGGTAKAQELLQALHQDENVKDDAVDLRVEEAKA